jgi:uncharacterized protein DUF4395
MKAIKFGETVEGYGIPVLNEREIRASAGILFLVMFIGWMQILFNENFLLIKYVITLFLTDFMIRVFVNPKYSPALIIGRWIVSQQTPEYVSAAPKKFAWSIGLVLSTTMFILLVVLNSTSFFTGISCMICLTFLFFESVFGICLGCLFYPWFYKEKTQLCPGGICTVKTKQEIQKISWLQTGIVIGFLGYIILIAYFFNHHLSQTPSDLSAILRAALS